MAEPAGTRLLPVLAALTIVVAGGLSPAPARASDALPLAEVIRQTLSRHPDMALARLKSQTADVEPERLQGLLDPSYKISALVSDDRDPSNFKFNPTTDTKFAQLKGSISKPLAAGDTLTLGADYNRTKQQFGQGPNLFSRFDPFYHNQIDLTWRHPLLRGKDRPDWREGLEAALADARAARLQERVTARALARKAIQLYFDIAVDEANLKLARAGVARAERLLRYQESRQRFGLIEEADRLQTAALLAERKLNAASAEESLARDITALNRLMLRRPDAPIHVRESLAPDAPVPALEDIMATALKRRPELRALDARLKAAEARLKVARDAQRMQLDVIAQAGTRALAGNAADAARQGFSVADRFISLGVELGDTIHDHAARADIRKAELARAEVLAERRQLEEQIRDDAASLVALIRTGRKAWRAAVARMHAEQKKFAAEVARYKAGRSDTATLIQFEGQLLAAQVEASLRRLSLLRNLRQLGWVEGVLLDELGVKLADAEAADANVAGEPANIRP